MGLYGIDVASCNSVPLCFPFCPVHLDSLKKGLDIEISVVVLRLLLGLQTKFSSSLGNKKLVLIPRHDCGADEFRKREIF